MTIQFERAIPIFPIFSLEKAREFYLDFLGVKLDWDASFDPNSPLFVQVSRGGLAVRLSEHHGDATPGSHAFVAMTGVKDLPRELHDKNYRHKRPSLQQQEWGMTELTVIDPFGSRIIFGEPTEKVA